jgi:hypothetical protein
MVVDSIPFQWRFSKRFSSFFVFFALTGCMYEEFLNSEPVESSPLLPALSCTPFIKGGYTEKVSYYPGEQMKIFLDPLEFTDICRLQIFSVTGDSVYATASEIPIVEEIPDDASENGYDLSVAAQITVPEIPSGIYLIDKKIPFIVKAPETVDVMIVYPSNTANAYAASGGKSLYSQQERPVAVSFERPIPLQSLSEYCLKWFTKLEDFRIGYVADIDMDDYEQISKAKVLVIPGHSEYWTRQARINFDRFVDSGGHALILSGNTMWWQVRYSDDRKKMYCYKSAATDSVADPLLETIEWTDPLLQYPIISSIGADFPRGGYGMKIDQGWNGYKISNPLSPLFEGLDLKKGDIISLPTLEYDGAPISGYDSEGYPVIDKEVLNFENIELLAFDKGFRVTETTATAIVFRKKSTSGIIVNTASTDWCSSNGMGGSSGDVIKRITFNALYKLLNDAPVFSQ